MEPIFSIRVHELMSERNMSDKDLERELNLPKDAIYNWKNNVSRSYPKYAKRIADFFGVSTAYLLGEVDFRFPIASEYPADLQFIIGKFFSMTLEGREKLVEQADMLSERYSQKNSADSVNEVTA